MPRRPPRRRLFAAFALLLVAGGAAGAACWWPSRTPQLHRPAGWPAPVYDIQRNPPTAAGFALGRKLFYDPRLSQDGSIACASCHQQFAAFAHFDHRVSHGLHGANGTRNAPGLFNLAWQPDFMWDGAVAHLELQPLAPLTNPVEMGETLPAVLARLRADPDYPRLFARAFGPGGDEGPIDSQRFLRALTQFLVTMISDDSRYDRYRAGRATFSDAETRGLAAFRTHCSACHVEPLFTDYRYRRNGLRGDDAGRAAISGNAADRGRFRVPSLRNVALTAPYMHDGRFDTLEQVLAHYRSGVPDALRDEPLLREATSVGAAEAEDIIAFLQTLTDERFVHDRRFSEAASR
ncbi:cytochrome-c peroxidase [Solimonas soli]|uniref:cytochrome-c peroxidase n=1 Tax=Solimonas soli TaxID=413479 RepID=UPI000488E99E|nr:cytochrome c peroxidase [Solimonas soli]